MLASNNVTYFYMIQAKVCRITVISKSVGKRSLAWDLIHFRRRRSRYFCCLLSPILRLDKRHFPIWQMNPYYFSENWFCYERIAFFLKFRIILGYFYKNFVKSICCMMIVNVTDFCSKISSNCFHNLKYCCVLSCSCFHGKSTKCAFVHYFFCVMEFWAMKKVICNAQRASSLTWLIYPEAGSVTTGFF